MAFGDRKKPLRADPEKQRAWQQRSRDRARARAQEEPRRPNSLSAARKPSGSNASRRRADDVPPEVRRAVRARSAGYCEARLDGCTGDATEQHHRLKRRAGVHTAENLVDLCHACHTDSPAAVHRNVRWAEGVGLLIRSTGEAPTEPWSRRNLG